MSLSLDAEIVVATDDRRIVEAISSIGVTGVLTGSQHESGTARIAEFVQMPDYAAYDTVLNIQGDQAFITSAAARGALDQVRDRVQIGTTGEPFGSDEELDDPNLVKVGVCEDGLALDFWRTGGPEQSVGRVLRHRGVYAYTREALLRWVQLPRTSREIHDRLEQLRPLAGGMPIGVADVPRSTLPEIDTLADVVRARARLEQELTGART